ncbi:MAG TPA: helicase-related protein [Chryseolinea sp.]|nr:helicase-related protein [Chryseolinea sp.]
MSSQFINPEERFFKPSLYERNLMPVDLFLYPFNDGLNEHKPEYPEFVYFISQHAKEALVIDILTREVICNGIVYVRTNFAADQLAAALNRSGITAESVHDNKSRRTRVKSFSNFQNNSTRVLVATESAASTMDATEVSLIINYDLPVSAETYTKRLIQHRSPAGNYTKTLSFCDESETGNLKNINRVLDKEIDVIEHSFA